jgi:hypothetical protein
MKPADIPASTDKDDPRRALERLASEFGPGDFTVTLAPPEEGPPRLSIASRHCPLTEDIFCDGHRYWYPWAEPIGPVDDPVAAAEKLARVLRPARQPAHG